MPNPDDGNGNGQIHFRTIAMYAGGFTVDDGPYRRFADPDNAEFLASVARGAIPRELREEARKSGAGKEVKVDMVDRRGEEYDPEDRQQGNGSGFESCSGEGQSLGVQGNSTSESVTGPSSASNSDATGSDVGDDGKAGKTCERTLTMYASGFTVDKALRADNGRILFRENGPYRRYADPDNAEFLASVARGAIPRELREEPRESGAREEVVVDMVDKRGEEYEP